MPEKFVRIFLQDFDQILQGNNLTILSLYIFARYLYLARKVSFLVQDLQDLVQDLARFPYFLQDGFYLVGLAEPCNFGSQN